MNRFHHERKVDQAYPLIPSVTFSPFTHITHTKVNTLSQSLFGLPNRLVLIHGYTCQSNILTFQYLQSFQTLNNSYSSVNSKECGRGVVIKQGGGIYKTECKMNI